MRRIAIVAMFAGCTTLPSEAPPTAPPTPPTPPPTAALASPAPPAPSTTSPEQLAQQFEQCWGFFNDSAWDEVKRCFAADATRATRVAR